ncbi:OmpA family protein [Hahella aquimaris]|uniref:OmpA family protein n=1 Tax=Hahella sp. HNIBRBA332 TaxID=3015983 RepID=UPI00273C3F5C|nr:OmpA family protein [Hahella sp. HNIBRBA332]WLQ12463.1 OmpA family protein [Hahella sp. HNIBRBA332]
MKAKLLPSILLVSAIASAQPALADGREKGAYFTGLLGYTFFDHERQIEDDPSLAAGLGYNFTPAISAEVLIGAADLERKHNTGYLDSVFYRVDALYHFNQGEAWRPYIVGGAGNYRFKYDGGGKDEETQYNLGAGIKHAISESMDVRFDARGVYGDEDETKDAMLNLGFTYMFASAAAAPMDSDRDGVYDDEDACPGTPYGATVDARGCEVIGDADGDGVTDDKDQCPNTKAGARVDATGCPVVGDDDADGVPNEKDQCPNSPAAAKVDSRGCPLDTDRDGITDGLDACPDTPYGAKVDNRGCRIQLSETVTITLNVTFPTNSAAIPDEFVSEVEKLAEFMRQYPDTKAVVEGHTDDRGQDAYNQKLSEKRANAVRQMVVERFGIAGERISSVGYGEARPIGDNNTAEGRSANRRVVAVVEATVKTNQ